MVSPLRHFTLVALILSGILSTGWTQTAGSKPPENVSNAKSVAVSTAANDPSKEAVILERNITTVSYEADGTGTSESIVVAKVQSQAGVTQLAVLKLPYISGNQIIEVDYVRVKKPDGTVVATPDYNIQDMPGEVSRVAPMYSDLHEKHITVKALGVGDVLEYKIRYRIVKPQVPGQFWFQYTFAKLIVTEDDELQISVPRDKYVKVESPDYPPQIKEEGARKTYSWKTSNPSIGDREKLLKQQENAKPSVQLTSFQSWEEVGNWYRSLQAPQQAVTPAIQAKVAELTKGLTGDEDKIRAIYEFVATRYHYVSLSFGVGRYQPHAAQDVFENEYGDCKDKHTLLAAMLNAAGYEAWPALINSTRKIDPAMPSPGEFDHVITVVPLGAKRIWLDTTPEVAPYGMLMGYLRDKQALVIPVGKSASLEEAGTLITTPAQPPFPAAQAFHVEGALDAEGTFTGHVQQSYRGDTEVLTRLAFRSVAPSQWKELAQAVSYREGFGGDVSNVAVPALDDIRQPFHLSYDYTKKKLGDWANHQIIAPLPWFGIEGTGNDDKKPDEPVKFGAIGELTYTSKTKLPEGYAPKYSDRLDLSEDFADYHAVYSIENGVLTANRQLVIKKSEVPLSSWEQYKKFCKALADERDRYIDLTTGTTVYPAGEGPNPAPAKQEANATKDSGKPATSSKLKTPEQLRDEAAKQNPEAADLMRQAAEAWDRRDIARANELAKKVLALDPKFLGVHFTLGYGYLMQNQPDQAIAEFRREIEYHPENPAYYGYFSQVLLKLNRTDEAIPVLRQWVDLDPSNVQAVSSLKLLLVDKGDYAQAQQVLEAAIKATPDSPTLQFDLAEVYLKNHKEAEGVALMKKALEAGGGSYNNAAYFLADANVDLALASSYAEKALKEAEDNTLHAASDNEGFKAALNLSYIWDTVGWVYFRNAKNEDAVKYLRAAWVLSQKPLDGDHLGQVYEKMGRTQDAVHIYQLALAALGGDKDNLRKRYEKLTHSKASDSDKPTLRRGAGASTPPPTEELSRMRTFKLPGKPTVTGSAVFNIVLSPGKVDSVRFDSGDESMKSLTPQLNGMNLKPDFPDNAPVKLYRQGMVVCSKLSGCELVLLLPDSVHAMDQPPATR